MLGRLVLAVPLAAALGLPLPLLQPPPALRPPPPALRPVAPPPHPAASVVAPAPRALPLDLVRVPEAGAPVAADRMLVRKTTGYRGTLPSDDAPIDELLRRLETQARLPRAARFESPWVAGAGLRLRVVYLRPLGAIEAEGLRVPLYAAGERVAYELEVENLGENPLVDVKVGARQERFRTGSPLGRSSEFSIAAVRHGARVVVRGSFTLSRSGRELVNLEQTHVTITTGGRTLLDDPLAGVVDPPGN